jgi:hypothetical protein
LRIPEKAAGGSFLGGQGRGPIETFRSLDISAPFSRLVSFSERAVVEHLTLIEA